jgi:DNA-binding MarR family transcriptional regulator
MDHRSAGTEQAAWGGFLRAYAHLDQAIDADLQARHGLRHTEFEVLLRLRWAPGVRLRIQDLARDSLLTRSGTSRLVDRLERAGLVAREAAAEDGRGSYAVLTRAGRDLFDRLQPEHLSFVRGLFHDRLTAEELRVLAGVWRKLLGDPGQAGRS